MSTQFKDKDDNNVATRFWGGDIRGTVVQFEVTEKEWESFEGSVFHESGWEFSKEVFMQVEVGEASVVWMSAFTHNRRAKEFEDMVESWSSPERKDGGFPVRWAAEQAQQERAKARAMMVVV